MILQPITKEFIESLGWVPERTTTGFTRVRKDGSYEWVKGKCIHYKQFGKEISHGSGANFCLFHGNGYKLNSVAFDKSMLIDYTALQKKLLNIKKNPYLYTAGEYLEVTRKLAALTR